MRAGLLVTMVVLLGGCHDAYKEDLQLICQSTEQAEFKGTRSMSGLATYIAENIHTDRARNIFKSIAVTGDPKTMVARIRDDALAAGITSCPFADYVEGSVK